MRFFLRAGAGLIVWSAGFAAIYALHGLGCALAWTDRPLLGGTLFTAVLVLVWALFLLAGGAVLLWSLRLSGARPFERRLAQVSAAAGLVALLLSGLPILFVSACV